MFTWERELPPELGRKHFTELEFHTSDPVPACGMKAKQVHLVLQSLKAFAMFGLVEVLLFEFFSLPGNEYSPTHPHNHTHTL